jgi:hypothetical protein
MNCVMTRTLLRGMGLAGMMGLVLPAMEGRAATILGHVNFTGTVTLDAPLATATAFTAFSNGQVEDGSGDYGVPSLIPVNTAVTVAAFSFDPFVPPVGALWSFSVAGTEYTLDLSTLEVERTTLEGNHFLSLSGTGTASLTGFEDTLADFAFTAQQAVGAVGTTVTYSVENVVPSLSVPEPGVAGLAGLSLLMLWRRRR